MWTWVGEWKLLFVLTVSLTCQKRVPTRLTEEKKNFQIDEKYYSTRLSLPLRVVSFTVQAPPAVKDTSPLRTNRGVEVPNESNEGWGAIIILSVAKNTWIRSDEDIVIKLPFVWSHFRTSSSITWISHVKPHITERNYFTQTKESTFGTYFDLANYFITFYDGCIFRVANIRESFVVSGQRMAIGQLWNMQTI